jgi:hypothetical protein
MRFDGAKGVVILEVLRESVTDEQRSDEHQIVALLRRLVMELEEGIPGNRRQLIQPVGRRLDSEQNGRNAMHRLWPIGFVAHFGFGHGSTRHARHWPVLAAPADDDFVEVGDVFEIHPNRVASIRRYADLEMPHHGNVPVLEAPGSRTHQRLVLHDGVALPAGVFRRCEDTARHDIASFGHRIDVGRRQPHEKRKQTSTIAVVVDLSSRFPCGGKHVDSVAMERRNALKRFFGRGLILRIEAKPGENALDRLLVQKVSPLLG